MHDSV